MGETRYLEKQSEELQKYEELCQRCGACCGIYDGDPCINLLKGDDQRYFCKVYDKRIGPQVTVSGKTFNCVPIRDLLKFDLPYSNCKYAINKGID